MGSAPDEDASFEYHRAHCPAECLHVAYVIGVDSIVACACVVGASVRLSETYTTALFRGENVTIASLPIPPDCHWINAFETPPMNCSAEAIATFGTPLLRVARELDHEDNFAWPTGDTARVKITISVRTNRLCANYKQIIPGTRLRRISTDPSQARTKVYTALDT